MAKGKQTPKKVAVVLSGCGFLDGAEIHEAVCTLLALDKNGVEAVCVAPDKPQASVMNHLTKQPESVGRNVLVESARIARGNIRKLGEIPADEVDAVILPGGYGAAKNLSNFAEGGETYSVDPDLERFLREVHAQGKPIGFLCIAPVIAAKLFGDIGVELTVGDSKEVAAALNKLGARHKNTKVSGFVVDRKNRVVTTACYMLATRVSEIYDGANKVVKEVLKLAKARKPAPAGRK